LAREVKTLQVTVGTFGLLPGGFSRSIISIPGYTDVARDKERWKEQRGRKARRETGERFLSQMSTSRTETRFSTHST